MHADTNFVYWLIDRGLIKEREVVSEGLLTVYYLGQRLKHIGRLTKSSRVSSKWGTGHLYEHGLFEVPSDYGNTVRFFTPCYQEDVVGDFIDYAISEGIPFDSAGEITLGPSRIAIASRDRLWF